MKKLLYFLIILGFFCAVRGIGPIDINGETFIWLNPVPAEFFWIPIFGAIAILIYRKYKK